MISRAKKQRYSEGAWDQAVLVAIDVVCITAALFLSATCLCGFHIRFFIEQKPFLVGSLYLINITSYYMLDLYHTTKDFRRYKQAVNLVLAIAVSFLMIWGMSFWDTTFILKRSFIGSFYIFLLIFSLISRGIFATIRNMAPLRNAIVIGSTEIGQQVIRKIDEMNSLGRGTGIKVVGYICNHRYWGKNDSGVEYLGGYENLENIIVEKNVSLLIYALNATADQKWNELVIHEKLRGMHLISAIALYSAISGMIPYEHINSSWLIEECLRGNKFSQIKVKRTIDIVAGVVLMILSFPLIAVCMLLIRFESRGPVLYIQERIGYLGKPFRIYKIRTMSEAGVADTAGNRVTHIGNFLRKYHLDELPQFLNVICGDMSIVGPRPEMEMFILQCEEHIPFYRLRLAIRPGITGWAQVWYPHTTSLDEYKIKFKYDLFYLAHLSLKMDFEIMARTVLRILGYPRIHHDPVDQNDEKK